MPVQRCFISTSNDPFYNLSLEEYYLKNIEDEVFMLYINKPSVVVGKHQNILKEINGRWSHEHNIILARRLSGGGTVYQDQGNLNFSFISNCPNLEKINYRKFTAPIVKTLNLLGIKAENSERNDLLLDGMKISGNAMHIHKNRVLCHGTLLFNSNLKDLSIALKNNPDKYIDKSIRSVSSKVTNISEYMTGSMSINDFTDEVFHKTMSFLEVPVKFSPTEDDISECKKLSYEKYSTWDWIYGYSPKYVFKGKIQLKKEAVDFELKVEKGIIKNIEFVNNGVSDLIFNVLRNVRHDYDTLKSIFTTEKIQDILPLYSLDELCLEFF